MLKSVLKQTPVQIVKKQVDWNKVYRGVERHNITSLLYYAILGTEKEIAEKQEQELYQKFKKELLLGTEYRQAQETISWQLEQNKIHALLLSGTEEYDLYYKKEMGSIDSLDFFVESDDLKKVQDLMQTMDYERKEDNRYSGLIYIRTPGIRVRFLNEIPIVGRRMQKMFKKQIKAAPRVQRINIEKKYIYNVAALMEQYLIGNITIRKILDFWLYWKKFNNKIAIEEISTLLDKSGMKEWEQCLVALGELWFGDGIPTEESELAFALEEYILNPGKIDKKLDYKVLPSGRRRLDFYERDREAEWRNKKWRWMFPSKEYMKEIFPILRRIPFLIIFCWGIRVSRILIKVIRQKAIEMQDRLLYMLKKLKNKGVKK